MIDAALFEVMIQKRKQTANRGVGLTRFEECRGRRSGANVSDTQAAMTSCCKGFGNQTGSRPFTKGTFLRGYQRAFLIGVIQLSILAVLLDQLIVPC